MDNRIDRVFKIIPSLSRYALALSGAETRADDVVGGSLDRMLAYTTPETESLEHFLVEGCRIAWLEMEQDDFDGMSQMHGAQRSSKGMGAVEISQTLDGLPSLQRKCLLMSIVDHKSYSEISATENITAGSVNNYISQARAAFINHFYATNNALREKQTPSLERYSDQRLNALLDNELDSIEAVRVRGALNFDPQLAKKLEELVLVDTLIISNLPVTDGVATYSPTHISTAHTSGYLH